MRILRLSYNKLTALPAELQVGSHLLPPHLLTHTASDPSHFCFLPSFLLFAQSLQALEVLALHTCPPHLPHTYLCAGPAGTGGACRRPQPADRYSG